MGWGTGCVEGRGAGESVVGYWHAGALRSLPPPSASRCSRPLRAAAAALCGPLTAHLPFAASRQCLPLLLSAARHGPPAAVARCCLPLAARPARHCPPTQPHPTLHLTSKCSKYIQSMLGMFGDCALHGADTLALRAAGGAPVEMENFFSRLTLDIIGKAVFNYDFDSLSNDDPFIKVRY